MWVEKLRRARESAAHGDEGAGLVLVLGTMSVLSILLLVLPMTLIPALKHRTSHQVYNQDLDAAESGLDAVLGKLMKSRSYTQGPDVPANVKANGWSSISDETSWARSTLSSLATNAANRVTTPTGEYVAIRPTSLQVVYSIGYTPNYAHATRVRVLKADYAFKRSSATSALLTSGDLNMSGSLVINAGSATASAVHTNGNVASNGSNSNTITGTVEAVGTDDFPGGISNATPQTIPTIDPRYLYTSMQPYYSSGWYDLCTDGKIHQGSSTGVPCSNPTIVTVANWSYSGGTWNENSGSTYTPGIFYAYRSNVSVTLNGGTATQSIITESTQNQTGVCPKTDGSFYVKKSTLKAYLPGVTVYSGANLEEDSNADLDGGLVAAQDGMYLHTSSSDGVQGNVVAGDVCPGDTNSVQGTEIIYSAYGGFPGPAPIQVTRELELK